MFIGGKCAGRDPSRRLSGGIANFDEKRIDTTAFFCIMKGAVVYYY